MGFSRQTRRQLPGCSLLLLIRCQRVAIHLGHQRAHHRRTRRHFHHLQLHTLGLQRREQRPDAQHNTVRLLLASGLVDQYHSEVGQLRCHTLVVPAHHAVEIDR